MSSVLYNDYKNNYNEYMKTVLYTEKIICDNNSDQNKLLNIYEKAIKSAESMLKRMQLEVETNSILENEYNELNDMHNKISECKSKLRKLKEEIMKKGQRNNEINNYDDRMLLLSDVDLLEQGDVYINQSRILMDNTEYISNDVMNNLNKQRECIKKNISNTSYVSDKFDQAKKILKSLKAKEILNKYRLNIIYLFIILTFILIFCVKINRYIKKDVNSNTQEKNRIPVEYMNNHNMGNLDDINTTDMANDVNNINAPNSIVYDFVNNEKIENKTERDKVKDKNSVNSDREDSSPDNKSTYGNNGSTNRATKMN